MPIQQKRLGSDSVELSADDRIYYVVGYNAETKRWDVTRNYRKALGFDTTIGQYGDAEEAVATVKAMLEDKEAELSTALDKLL